MSSVWIKQCFVIFFSLLWAFRVSLGRLGFWSYLEILGFFNSFFLFNFSWGLQGLLVKQALCNFFFTSGFMGCTVLFRGFRILLIPYFLKLCVCGSQFRSHCG